MHLQNMYSLFESLSCTLRHPHTQVPKQPWCSSGVIWVRRRAPDSPDKWLTDEASGPGSARRRTCSVPASKSAARFLNTWHEQWRSQREHPPVPRVMQACNHHWGVAPRQTRPQCLVGALATGTSAVTKVEVLPVAQSVSGRVKAVLFC